MDDKNVEYFKRMTVELRRARARVAELEAERGEGVAIVGIGLRLPGGIDTPEQFWDLLASGRHIVGGFPTDRGWDLAALFGDDEAAGGRSISRHGAFLDDAGDFDAEFFGISPREAAATDPQQRLVLESSWEALERAGIDPTSLHGSELGVFMGATSQGYGSESRSESEGFLLTGSAPAALSGRVSYVLGTHGPSITVDTACSSSLVSLHLAAQSLRAGECSLALAGGATVMTTPVAFTEVTRLGGMAADGRCKSFSADADGTGWSEGVGVLALQRLSDAVREGREILAVLRGSAVNQDGASNGLTAPNGPAQQKVIRQALANAGVRASEVDAVEAHGTGTVLGDPIEAQAIMAVYGQDRETPLRLGSVKSNLGHTQLAAGVVGVIKMVLALRNDLLPLTLNVTRPTDKVDWSQGSVELLTEALPWKRNGHPRRAGVSSFGVAGTNAHAILEEAPSVESAVLPVEPAGPVPLVVTARSAAALAAQAARLAEHLAQPGVDRAGVARSLVTSRARWEHRAVILGDGLPELAAGRSAEDVVTAVAGDEPRTVFVFPGQGAQWVGMGRDLWRSQPVFATRMEECEQALASYVDWSLRDVVLGAGSLDRVEVLQPVTFAVMVSLAALLASHGVRPDAVVGHSQGEIAAACVAGALSLADAAKVVALRAATGADLGRGGGLLTVALPAAEIEPWDGIEIAAVNGPRSVVLAGPDEAIAEVERHYRERDVRVRTVAASFASHTRHAEPIAAKVLELLADVRGQAPTVPWMSTVDADWVREPIDAGYWGRNLVQRVRFADAIANLRDFGLFVEVSTHPVLAAPISDTLAGTDASVIGMLRRDDGGTDRYVRSLAEIFTHGGPVDWTSVLPEAKPAPVPTTAFTHRRYWLLPDPATDVSRLGLDSVHHPILGAALPDPKGRGVVLSGTVSRASDLTGALFPELAARAGQHVGSPVVHELALTAPLVLDEDRVTVQVVVGEPGPAGLRSIEIYSRTADEWTRHAEGTLSTVSDTPEPLTQWPPAGTAVDDFYETLADAGYDCDPALRTVRRAWRDGDTWYAELATDADPAGYVIHPALLESVAQLAGGPVTAWHGFAPHATAGTALRVRLTADLAVTIADDAGRPVATIGSLSTRPLPFAPRPYVVSWIPIPDQPVGTVELPSVDDGGDQPWALLRVAPDTSREAVVEALQRFRTGPTRLVIATDGAATDPVAASIWGLVRSAAAETPDRFVLVDAPGPIPAVLDSGEWQIVVRDGQVLVPRLARLDRPPVERTLAGTVLITGDTAFGSIVAEHLVAEHGEAVRVVRGDIADRDQAAELLAANGPLTAVIHAGDLDAARHLDELTREQDLRAFVLFSSAAGVLSTAGRAEEAAAGAFLNALATRRRAAGLPATALAWDDLPDTERLRLLDVALAADEPVLVPVRIDRAALRERGTTDPMLRDFLPRATAVAPGPADLATLDAGAKMEVLTDLVRREAAIVLRHDVADGGLAATKVFREAGFDSLTAVELRNRLSRALDLTLPVTWVFDHETPRAAARDLLDRLAAPPEAPASNRDFVGVYAALVERGLQPVANDLARAAAAVRDRAATVAELTGGVRTTTLAAGTKLPKLVCVPSIATWEPVLNYSALATHFTGIADVTVIVPPGYETDTPVAATWAALVDTLADAVRREVGDQPYLLVGYSGGGALVHEIAAALELAEAHLPAGVVLIDVHTNDNLPPRMLDFFRQQYQAITRAENYSFEKITASVLYIGMYLDQWRLDRALAVPELLLKAANPPETPAGEPPLADEEWRQDWPFPVDVRTLPGDHFTIMSRHAGEVARAIVSWYETHPRAAECRTGNK
ncbi:type I polyketide synthase [Kutzneria kofuensis]|uniref:Acyl transferase domain-containing protein/thioesterase domain-containing protein n=1 Tax=Kutzneria kofuensis TaxID=103725 RepID=A0A7W9NL62_9PSEU|nr:type I polyketide synthase [Kutzneria kofuensis]MBB5896424.1 acyl transferase domain-containing protein/thioesterase domain-containing protein [Kutzneria kofuensis]